MKVFWSPQLRDDSPLYSKQGDILTLNGDVLDLSDFPDGAEIAELEARQLHPLISGPIARVGGQLRLTLISPAWGHSSEAVRFPEPSIEPPDGPLHYPSDPEPDPIELLPEEPEA